MTNNPNSTVVEKLAAAIGVDIKSIAKTLDFYGSPYRVYTALLNQTGTDAPTAIVLENTFPFEPTFLYESDGTYSMVFPFEISIEKLFILYNPTTLDRMITNSAFTEIYYEGPGVNESRIKITTGILPDSPSNAELFYNPIEIRVYN